MSLLFRWRIDTEVWHGHNFKSMSISTMTFSPGEQFQTVLHDGRDCLVTMEVDVENGVMRTIQRPVDTSLPATTIERIFSEEGLVMTMACGDVFAESEFTRCLEEEEQSYLY